SILDGNNPEILSSINNGVRNYAGSRGAQLASYLINDCFGVSSFLFVVMGSVLGLHLMRVRQFHVWKWFFCCLFLLIWFSVFLGFTLMELYEDSFICWGGMHGYNAGLWLMSQVGSPGTVMILLATGLCFLIYVSTKTIILIRRFFDMRHIRRRKRIIAKYRDNTAVNDVSTETVPTKPIETPETSSDDDDTDEMGMTFETTEPDDISFTVSQPIEKENTSLGIETSNENGDDEENYQGVETEPYNPTLDLENYRFPTL
ncbi:hypothetical protein EZS27_040602, partial [termite gut metagenome]